MQSRGGPTGVARQVPSLTASSLPKHPSNPLTFEDVEEVAAPGGVHQQGDGAAGEDRVLSTRKATELGYMGHPHAMAAARWALVWQHTGKKLKSRVWTTFPSAGGRLLYSNTGVACVGANLLSYLEVRRGLLRRGRPHGHGLQPPVSRRLLHLVAQAASLAAATAVATRLAAAAPCA